MWAEFDLENLMGVNFTGGLNFGLLHWLCLWALTYCSATALPVIRAWLFAHYCCPLAYRLAGTIFGCDTCGCVRLSVRLSLKMVLYTSSKDQNVSQWSLYCPITFLTLKGQRSKTQKSRTRRNLFWSIVNSLI